MRMHKTEYDIKLFSSARTSRVKRITLAPPFLIFTVFGISILLQLPAGYVIHHASFSLGMLLNQVGAILIPVLLVIRFFGLTRGEVLPFKRFGILQISTAVVMMFSLAVMSDYVIYITELIVPVSEPLHERYRELMDVKGWGSLVHKFLFLCILPGFCEEIFFRGFCQTGLSRQYGMSAGLFIVAAMFAVAHLDSLYVHIYFILGLVLSWLFAGSGTLWIPVICHIANNLTTFTLYLLNCTLPYGGSFGWLDIPILVASIAVFAVAVWAWRRRV